MKYFLKIYRANRYLAHILLFFYLFAILVSGIAGHSRNISDDDQVIASPPAAVLSNNDEVAFLKEDPESISLPLLGKYSLPVRAPPVHFIEIA